MAMLRVAVHRETAREEPDGCLSTDSVISPASLHQNCPLLASNCPCHDIEEACLGGG
jgi:hypothetical protein